MLANERSFKILLKKNFLYIFLIIVFSFESLAIADEKKNIIEKLKNTKSLKFNFKQNTNEKIETGVCYLVFPKKLKCDYKDNKQKELIINNNRLAITQKRYNKTFYYSVKKSPFIKILDKNQLINLIEGSILNYKNNQIHLTSINHDKKKITILFKKKNFDLIGWKINDQFENKISFLIKILSENQEINLKIFEIPN
mgnify:FL=1